ncbi:MAG: ROK family protein [Brevinema sp.]
MNYLGIDLGGTTVKYGLVDSLGQVSEKGDFPTKSKDADELLDKIAALIEDMKTKHHIQGVGICAPGVINPFTGTIVWAGGNMPDGWAGTEFKQILEQRTSLPISIDNDVNCAALGEKWIGAGQDIQHFICIAVGTGIGSGIVINNHLYYGGGFQAGEIGYIHANKGCTNFWEKEASTLNFVANIKKMLVENGEKEDNLDYVDGLWIFENVSKNPIVAKVFDEWMDCLARGISDAACILNPQAVILGGGISGQGDNFLNLIKPKVQSYLPNGFHVEIRIAQAGNDAGKIGAVKKLIDEIK